MICQLSSSLIKENGFSRNGISIIFFHLLFFFSLAKTDLSLSCQIYNCISLCSGQVRLAFLKNTSAFQALQARMGRTQEKLASSYMQSEEKTWEFYPACLSRSPRFFAEILQNLFQITNQTITGNWIISMLICILCISSSYVCEGIQGKPVALNGLQLVSVWAVSHKWLLPALTRKGDGTMWDTDLAGQGK